MTRDEMIEAFAAKAGCEVDQVAVTAEPVSAFGRWGALKGVRFFRGGTLAAPAPTFRIDDVQARKGSERFTLWIMDLGSERLVYGDGMAEMMPDPGLPDPVEMVRAVLAIIGPRDGDGVRVIVDQAMREDPRVTPREVAEIVMDAEADAKGSA